MANSFLEADILGDFAMTKSNNKSNLSHQTIGVEFVRLQDQYLKGQENKQNTIFLIWMYLKSPQKSVNQWFYRAR